MKNNTIIQGDCIKVLNEKIDKESIDLIFSDPPYNLSGSKLNLKNNTTGGAYYKVDEEWDTFTKSDYAKFTFAWIDACKSVLKSNGSLYISCTQHNIGELTIAAKELGFELKNILTWFKVNAMPNITKRTFTHSTICFMVLKGKTGYLTTTKSKNLIPIKQKKERYRCFLLDFIELPIVQGRKVEVKMAGHFIQHKNQQNSLSL